MEGTSAEGYRGERTQQEAKVTIMEGGNDELRPLWGIMRKKAEGHEWCATTSTTTSFVKEWEWEDCNGAGASMPTVEGDISA